MSKAEPGHLIDGFGTFVRRQVIKKKADLVVAVGGPQLLQILLKLRYVDRLLEDLVVLLPLLLGNSRQQSQSGLLQLVLIHS